MIEEDIATSPAVSILLSKCHVAFLEEISSLEEEAKESLGLDIRLFSNASSLLSVNSGYQEHAVLQATTLCLYQLLHYLGEAERQSATFDNLFDEILEITGFCAGLIPAAVVASSRDIGQFITFGVEAFRLVFWISYRAMDQSQKYGGKQSPDTSWSLAISGLDEAKVRESIAGVNAHVRCSCCSHGIKAHVRQCASQTLRVSAVSYPDVISVSGPPQDLVRLKLLLGPQNTSKFAHVHAWYHGGDQLQEVVLQIERDIANRKVRFPSASDMSKPLRSTLDASIFQAGPSADRLDIWVVRHLLIHCVHWSTVFRSLLQLAYHTLESKKNVFIQIESYGPSSKLLLAEAKSQPDYPRLQVRDLSPFAFPRRSDNRVKGQEGIAIVGMGLDLPKGKGAQELWQTISSGLSAVKEVSNSP